jgi:hydrogenase 3 maturation protease
VERLKATLRKRLSDSRRVAVVGIGSQFRGDDSCGLIAAHVLKKRKPSRSRKVRVFIGATAPENLTGAVRKFKPDHVILLDAADFRKKPGTVRLIPPKEAQGTCFCTHQIPLQIMADYIVQTMDAQVSIIGIQVKTLDFGAPLGKPVQKAAEELGKTLAAVLDGKE